MGWRSLCHLKAFFSNQVSCSWVSQRTHRKSILFGLTCQCCGLSFFLFFTIIVDQERSELIRLAMNWAYLVAQCKKNSAVYVWVNGNLHLLALGKVLFWLVAVFAYVASHTTSLFRNITLSRPHFVREKDSHRAWELHALFFTNSVWVL